jgi:hypothetical protein
MSAESVMAAEPGGGEARTSQPLDEVMLAMDVVDTLRRRQRLVERELDAEGREQDLRQRLRKIYAAQGIEVPDHVLDEGVAALKEERFVYKAPPESFATRLARVYVSRGRWGKWVLGTVAGLLGAWLLYYTLVVAPRAELPERLQAAYQSVLDATQDADVESRAQEFYTAGTAAFDVGDEGRARNALESLRELQGILQQSYTLTIVSRPGERSGVWRIPEANPDARNYYIIVEAVAPDGTTLQVPVVNEETGRTERVAKWGMRVEEDVFNRIAKDKQDDGIIQQREFGVKRSGELQPDYRIPTTGAAITQW